MNNPKTILLATLLLVLLQACGQQQTSQEKNTPTEEFMVVEKLPNYPGGFEAFYTFVKNEIRYPLEARKNGTEGKVELQFIIERDGNISSITVNKGIGDGCDEEAIRVLKLAPAFEAAEQRGRSVRIRMKLPIIFEINQEAKNPDGSNQGIVIVKELAIVAERLLVEASFDDGQWTGKVMTEDRAPLPGANVVVSGGTDGTVSDLDGDFILPTEANSRIVISFIGFETITLGN